MFKTSEKRLQRLIKMQSDEKCALVVRKHWFIFARSALPTFFVILILWVAISVFLKMLGASDAYISFWQAFVLLIGAMLLFVIWTNYFLDMWIITNKRLVDIEQVKLFKRVVTATRIDLVQDITVKIPGFIATMLNFGNLTVQTAGAALKNIHIDGISNPNYVKQVILKYLDAALDQNKKQA